jgi:tRNA A37 threonylcarbamoyladenosine dehydratase
VSSAPDQHQRFGGIERLYGTGVLERLAQAHVCVVGLGGVGSWAVEALARSGVGAITIVDLDDVCVTNINRQLPALDGTIGRPKAEVLAERVRAINPACRVTARIEFFTEGTAGRLLEGERFDYVIDAIDALKNKALLIARCRAAGIRVITCGGAGGRRDATGVRVDDLAFTHRDPLLRYVRKKLRSRHGFSRDVEQPFGVLAVYTQEMPLYPQSDGTVCEFAEVGEEGGIGCASGIGAAAFVTGAFGFAAAGVVVNALANPTDSGVTNQKEPRMDTDRHG